MATNKNMCHQSDNKHNVNFFNMIFLKYEKANIFRKKKNYEINFDYD